MDPCCACECAQVSLHKHRAAGSLQKMCSEEASGGSPAPLARLVAVPGAQMENKASLSHRCSFATENVRHRPAGCEEKCADYDHQEVVMAQEIV